GRARICGSGECRAERDKACHSRDESRYAGSPRKCSRPRYRHRVARSARGGAVGASGSSPVSQQSPCCELCDSVIEIVGGSDRDPGSTQPSLGRALNFSEPAALALQFEREDAAFENANNVRNSGDSADGFEDLGLNFATPAAGWIMKAKNVRPCGPCEVLDHSPLHLLLGTISP